MQPQQLNIKHFRNICTARLDFHTRLNFLCGDNAQGKTNALEALAYALTLRPLRNARVSDLVQDQGEQARIALRLAGPSRLPWTVEVELSRSGRRVVVNNKNLRDPATLLGAVAVVSFIPDDLELVKEGPEARRRSLDRFVFQVQPSHLAHLRDYGRALRSRNLLLRKPKLDEASLQAFTETLVQAGARLMRGRQRGVALLDPAIQERHKQLAPGGGILRMRYAPSVDPGLAARTDDPDTVDSETLLTADDGALKATQDALRQAFAASLRTDLLRRQTCRGPHLDALDLLLDGQRSRGFASQGQARSIVLAWRLAEVDQLAEIRGQGPLLLADDVVAELDDRRAEALLKTLDATGAFVVATGTRVPKILQGRDDVQIFFVRAGAITPA